MVFGGHPSPSSLLLAPHPGSELHISPQVLLEGWSCSPLVLTAQASRIRVSLSALSGVGGHRARKANWVKSFTGQTLDLLPSPEYLHFWCVLGIAGISALLPYSLVPRLEGDPQVFLLGLGTSSSSPLALQSPPRLLPRKESSESHTRSRQLQGSGDLRGRPWGGRET